MATFSRSQLSQHETAFISWIRRQGQNPAEAIDLFVQHAPYMSELLAHLPDAERTQLSQTTREYLASRVTDSAFVAQFPTIHHCRDRQGRELRYSITLTIGDDQAAWVGRIWAGDEYLGEITGSGTGPKANYLNLARMHIESQIDCEGAIIRRPLPDYW